MTYEEESVERWERRGMQNYRYSMEEKYNSSDLYVASIVYLTNDEKFKFFDTEDIKISSKKYIFTKLKNGKYQEIFTGFITEEWPELSENKGIPYIYQIKKFEVLFPETHNEKLDKIDLIISLNYIEDRIKSQEKLKQQNKYSDDYDEETQKRDTNAVKEFTKSGLFKKMNDIK